MTPELLDTKPGSATFRDLCGSFGYDSREAMKSCMSLSFPTHLSSLIHEPQVPINGPAATATASLTRWLSLEPELGWAGLKRWLHDDDDSDLAAQSVLLR